jgi:hypothetical protein
VPVLLRLTILFWMIVAGAPALAATTRSCPYSTEITALADGLLSDLHSANPGVARAFGRDAAFVKLYYGTLDEDGIDAVLGELQGGHAESASAFAFAYYLTSLGFDQAKQKMGAGLQSAIEGPIDLTLMRALAKAGRFDLAVTRMSKFTLQPQRRRFLPLALPFIDNTAAERLRLAAMADKGGAVVLAGELYASLPDDSGWNAYLKRHFRELGYLNLGGNFFVFSAMNADKQPLRNPKNRSDGVMFRTFVQRVSATAWLVPGPSLLYQYLAQFKFQPVYPSRAAIALRAAYDRHDLKPSGPVEQGWLATYRALVVATEKDAPGLVAANMQKVKIASRRYLDGSAGDILDTMLAGEAIGPWLANPAAPFPAPPPLASKALKAGWERWRAVAVAIRDHREMKGSAVDAATRGMTADLLYAGRDAGRLVAVIGAEPNDALRQRLEIDFISRLDRLCDASLYFPGEGLFLRDSTIYRFDILGYSL